MYICTGINYSSYIMTLWNIKEPENRLSKTVPKRNNKLYKHDPFLCIKNTKSNERIFIKLSQKVGNVLSC